MEQFVKAFLTGKGFQVNQNALSIIEKCDDWYANRLIRGFHNRETVQGRKYKLHQLNFAKRCCSDDANLCEVVEINAGSNQEQNGAVNEILSTSGFNTQYRKQLERTSAAGTAACYIRLDKADIMEDGMIQGGRIRLNYVEADCFIPLTVENDIVTEAAFSATGLRAGRKETTLVMFLKPQGLYTAETHVFDDKGNELKDREDIVTLGDVKPFAVMRNAEVNNLDDMAGYGLPKLLNAIPYLKAVDLCYNVLYGDLDKADKLLLVNELLCTFDANGKAVTPNEQAKKLFVLLGKRLPEQKELIQEYNPEIRVDETTKCFELALSLLSMSFGYGTKKYSFENGQITTATEYIGERQDQMQELNRQRQEAVRYIQDICRAVMWFSNTFHGTAYDPDAEILVDFDDSYITDRESELERKRNDALSFDIPQLTIWYLMDAYSLDEKEATEMVMAQRERQEEDPEGEEED